MAETNTCKLLAFQAPAHLRHYLSLYTYHRGFTKSKVLKQALSSWYLTTSNLYPEQDLVKQIINDLQQSWRTIKFDNETDKQNKFVNFKYAESLKMRNKGMKEEMIADIFKGVVI